MSYAESWVRMLLPMKNMNAAQKLILMDIVLHEDPNKPFRGLNSYKRLQTSRHTYNKQLRALRDKGFVKAVGKGMYVLNIDIF